MSALLGKIARRSRRRVALEGFERCTTCGSGGIDALVTTTKPVRCAECFAIERGHSPIERHHVAGAANSDFTIAVRANVHRWLTAMQRAWPPKTLRNPERSESLRLAAWLRGIADLLYCAASLLEEAS